MTAFLPAMQFGIPPWFFDDQTNLICKSFVDFHEQIIYPYISELPLDGQPIIRPLWWIEPENNLIFDMNDQFLVGDHILVAPVLEPGLKSRKIYFPIGNWYDKLNDCYYQGPSTIADYSLKLETIPFFYSINSTQSSVFKLTKSIQLCSLETQN